MPVDCRALRRRGARKGPQAQSRVEESQPHRGRTGSSPSSVTHELSGTPLLRDKNFDPKSEQLKIHEQEFRTSSTNEQRPRPVRNVRQSGGPGGHSRMRSAAYEEREAWAVRSG